jgi:ribosome-binding factor A
VNPRRSARLAEQIREEVTEIIGGKLKDPRIGFVTVTRVVLTADQSQARVYVGVLGEQQERTRSLEGLRAAAPFVRRELGRRIRLRHTPEVEFEYDRGLDSTDRVAQLLEEARAGKTDSGDEDA